MLSNIELSIMDSIPDIPLEFCRTVHDLGLMLLVDDIHDIGYFTYFGRWHHIYRGKRSPHHPSPLHHWQLGIVMLLLAKIAGLMTIAKENLQVLGEDDDNDSVEYDDYVREFEDEYRPPALTDNRVVAKIPKLSIRL